MFQAQGPAYESAGRSGRRGEDLGGPGDAGGLVQAFFDIFFVRGE